MTADLSNCWEEARQLCEDNEWDINICMYINKSCPLEEQAKNKRRRIETTINVVGVVYVKRAMDTHTLVRVL